MTIRPALPEDCAGIAEIENDAIATQFAHFGTTPTTAEQTAQALAAAKGRYPWIVAENDGQTVGFARATPWKPREAYSRTCEIGVYVKPGKQGQGIGRQLYNRLFEELKRLGFRTVLAGIALPNEPSARLHEAMGMHHIGTLPNVGFKFGEWRNVGYWVIELPTEAPRIAP